MTDRLQSWVRGLVTWVRFGSAIRCTEIHGMDSEIAPLSQTLLPCGQPLSSLPLAFGSPHMGGILTAGSVRTAGFSTRHLQSTMVRLGNEVQMARSPPSVSTVPCSNFSAPLTIQLPS